MYKKETSLTTWVGIGSFIIWLANGWGFYLFLTAFCILLGYVNSKKQPPTYHIDEEGQTIDSELTGMLREEEGGATYRIPINPTKKQPHKKFPMHWRIGIGLLVFSIFMASQDPRKKTQTNAPKVKQEQETEKPRQSLLYQMMNPDEEAPKR